MWCYTIGGKGSSFYGRKHDTILLYSKSPNYTFNGKDKNVIVQRKLNTHMRTKLMMTEENTKRKLIKKVVKFIVIM